MLRTFLTYRPRASLVWSVGVHAALGVALWGSGVVRFPQQGTSNGLMVGMLTQVAPVPPPAPSPVYEPLEVEPLVDPDFADELADLTDEVMPVPEQPFSPDRLEARALTRHQLPTRRRAQVPAPLHEPLATSDLSPIEPAVQEAVASAETPKATGPTELSAFCPPPPYPRVAERRGLQGTVELLVHVRPDGRVQRVEIARSSGHAILDQAAVEAVNQWRYAPATEAGVPVARSLTKRIAFRIP